MTQPLPSHTEDNPLGVETQEVNGVHVFRFHNAKILSDHSVQEMGNRLLTCLATISDPPHLAISFEGVQFFSSAAIGKLIMIQRKVKERSGELLLFDVNATTQDAFRVAHLQDYFKFYPDLPAALAACS
ncbi:MAG TPA: STAS domain-containing protein [Isosphaeraceae bacterium]|nr:STAS domain-containing protein [Isosphaeraceae bacterium]